MIYCGKGVRIRSFCGQYFSALGLNIEAYSVNLRFSPKTGKHRPEKLWIRTLFTQRFNSKNFSCYYAEHQSSIWTLLFSVHYFREKALSGVFQGPEYTFGGLNLGFMAGLRHFKPAFLATIMLYKNQRTSKI